LLPKPGNAKSCSGVGGRNPSANDRRRSRASDGRNVVPPRNETSENDRASLTVGSGMHLVVGDAIAIAAHAADDRPAAEGDHESCAKRAPLVEPAAFEDDGLDGS
jgi:hypothetical protein